MSDEQSDELHGIRVVVPLRQYLPVSGISNVGTSTDHLFESCKFGCYLLKYKV